MAVKTCIMYPCLSFSLACASLSPSVYLATLSYIPCSLLVQGLWTCCSYPFKCSFHPSTCYLSSTVTTSGKSSETFLIGPDPHFLALRALSLYSLCPSDSIPILPCWHGHLGTVCFLPEIVSIVRAGARSDCAFSVWHRVWHPVGIPHILID